MFSHQVNDHPAGEGPSSPTKASANAEEDEDDELDMNELNELEASLLKTSLQIQEPVNHS